MTMWKVTSRYGETVHFPLCRVQSIAVPPKPEGRVAAVAIYFIGGGNVEVEYSKEVVNSLLVALVDEPDPR